VLLGAVVAGSTAPIATVVPAAGGDTKPLWISYFARPRRLPRRCCADSCPLAARTAVRHRRWPACCQVSVRGGEEGGRKWGGKRCGTRHALLWHPPVAPL